MRHRGGGRTFTTARGSWPLTRRAIARHPLRLGIALRSRFSLNRRPRSGRWGEGFRRRPVAAFPIAVAPRTPPRVWLDLAWRGVPAVSAPRGAATETGARHPASRPRAMHAHAISGVCGARRPIAARIADERRKRPLVELDKAQKAPRSQRWGWQARRHHKLQRFCWIQDRAQAQPLRRAQSRAAGFRRS